MQSQPIPPFHRLSSFTLEGNRRPQIDGTIWRRCRKLDRRAEDDGTKERGQ